MIKPPVGMVSAGGFRRLPMHVGAHYRYFQAEQRGQVPHPFFMIGASAGGLATLANLPWTEENFKKVAYTVVNLRQRDMFTIPTEVKIVAGLSTTVSFLGLGYVLFHDFIFNDPTRTMASSSGLSRRVRLGIEVARTILSLGVGAAPLYELLFRQDSLYSNAPLRRFLKHPQKGLDFRGIWNSDIKVEIPAVDILTGKEYIFSLDENRGCPDRDDRLISALLASSSLPAHFPLEKLDDQLLDDAAILNSIPIHRAVAAGCQTIFVLLYSNNGGVSAIDGWTDELTRALDISMSEIISLNLGGHIAINQCLLINRQIRQEITELEESLQQLNQLTVGIEKQKTKDFIYNQLQTKLGRLQAKLNNFPFAEKKLTTIIPVFSDEPIPGQYFRKFKPELMEKALNLGYAAMDKTLAQLD